MSFEEIIYMMECAQDYMDLYDASANIVDDELRIAVEQLISECEEDGDSVEVAYSVVTSDLLDMNRSELNEGLSLFDNEEENNSKTINDYIDDMSNVSNDKDLLNIIDNMAENKSIDVDLVGNVRQLFRNNRFMPLSDKLETIKKFIADNSDVELEESKDSLTESTAVDDGSDSESDAIIEKSINETDDEIVKVLEDRVGQQFSVGEFNSLLQNALGQQNRMFLLTSDLGNMDLDTTQLLEIEDDDITYEVKYDIIDMNTGIIELTGVEKKG